MQPGDTYTETAGSQVSAAIIVLWNFCHFLGTLWVDLMTQYYRIFTLNPLVWRLAGEACPGSQ